MRTLELEKTSPQGAGDIEGTAGPDSTADGPTTRGEAVAWVLAVVSIVVVLTVVVIPVAYAFGYPEGGLLADVLMAWIPALALGLGALLRIGRQGGVAVGLLLGGVVGLGLAVFLGSTPMRGFGLLLPPTTGFAMGLLDGVGRARFAGFRSGITAAVAISFAVSLGLIARQGWTVVFPALLLGLLIGTLIGIRKDPDLGWRGGFQRPPWILLGVNILLLAAMVALLRYEFSTARSAWFETADPLIAALQFVGLFLILGPMVSFSAGSALARWLRPRLEVFRQLVSYLRAMYIPIGAFALGYSLILLVFAGVYGSLYRIDPSHFGAPDTVPSRADWVFFALYSAVGTVYSALRPSSGLAHLAVAGQALLGVGWAVVVFAAVMSYLQPKLAAVGHRLREADRRSSGEHTDVS